jgi:hypothetical protein
MGAIATSGILVLNDAVVDASALAAGRKQHSGARAAEAPPAAVPCPPAHLGVRRRAGVSPGHADGAALGDEMAILLVFMAVMAPSWVCRVQEDRAPMLSPWYSGVTLGHAEFWLKTRHLVAEEVERCA